MQRDFFSLIKTVIFDLDGVLIESKQIHYKTLNKVLPEKYSISYEDHLSTYDTLPKQQKLKLLSLNKDLLDETLILEDSHIGRQVVLEAGCYLLPIIDTYDVTLEKIDTKIYELNQNTTTNIPRRSN